jgi:hypothetical protein
MGWVTFLPACLPACLFLPAHLVGSGDDKSKKKKDDDEPNGGAGTGGGRQFEGAFNWNGPRSRMAVKQIGGHGGGGDRRRMLGGG